MDWMDGFGQILMSAQIQRPIPALPYATTHQGAIAALAHLEPLEVEEGMAPAVSLS